MTIEEIKGNCNSNHHDDDDYYDARTYRKALAIAIGALEESSGFWMTNKDALEEIEKLFS